MTTATGPDAVAVDTSVMSAAITQALLAASYQRHLTGRRIVLSFQTVAELRFGALKANWGTQRRAALEARIAALTIVPADNGLASSWAALRDICRRSGHALGDKRHAADLWIAVTAVHYGLPLVAHDGVFKGVPGLRLITELP